MLFPFLRTRCWNRGLLLGLLILFAPPDRAAALVAQDCAVPGADCTLAETARQAGVLIGAAIVSPDLPPEQATIPREFNSITAENAMKWGELAQTVGNYDFADADAIADFATATGVRLRGHALLWRQQLPADLESIVAAAAEPETLLRELIEEHFSTMIPRYRDDVAVWDVVNEPLDVFTGNLGPGIFARTLGEAYIDEAFHLAHELDPDARLVLNEFFDFYDLQTPLGGKAQSFIDLVERLLDRGVPIHGVGIQAHFNGILPTAVLPSRERFEGFLRSLSDLGVAVELTELDVSIYYFRDDPDPYARQAEFYAEIVAACMAVSGCTDVTTWGIDDSRSWLDTVPPFNLLAPHEPLLFDGALEPKPAYFAVRSALAAREGPFHERVARLVRFFDEARAGGDLRGRRWVLRWIRRSLAWAGSTVERGQFRAACHRLEGVDWLLAPRHRWPHQWRLVRGPGAEELADGVRTLRTALDCDDRHFTGRERAGR